jgi:hypothetical protein
VRLQAQPSAVTSSVLASGSTTNPNIGYGPASANLTAAQITQAAVAATPLVTATLPSPGTPFRWTLPDDTRELHNLTAMFAYYYHMYTVWVRTAACCGPYAIPLHLPGPAAWTCCLDLPRHACLGHTPLQIWYGILQSIVLALLMMRLINMVAFQPRIAIISGECQQPQAISRHCLCPPTHSCLLTSPDLPLLCFAAGALAHFLSDFLHFLLVLVTVIVMLSIICVTIMGYRSEDLSDISSAISSMLQYMFTGGCAPQARHGHSLH